jgi:two-component system, OmpR family, response regulator
MLSERNLRVLIVDDSTQQLDLTARQLRLSGFEVATTPSSFGVSNLIRNFAPDVVLLDVEIPALSGDRLLEIARRHAPTGTRFVLFSACDAGKLRNLAKQSGADDWISKSEPADGLVARLRALCDTKS